MLESLLTRLNSIPSDKVMHFASGAVVFTMFLPFIGPYYAMLAVIIVAIGKEVYDAMHQDKHTADIWDAVATTLGGVLVFSCT